MDQSILKTLLEALEVYEGDPEEIEIARNWLYTAYSVSRMTSEEIADVHAAIAEYEKEEAAGIFFTHEEVMQEMKDLIENYQPEKEPVKV
jgi:predicted transcriptional regulator